MNHKPTRLLIWGGGQDFRLVLPSLRALEQSGKIQIVGVVDRKRPEDGMINGYPHVMPEEISGRDYDYVQICSTAYKKEIRENYLKLPGADPEKVIGHCYPELSEEQHSRLEKDRPTIFSSSCWGGLVYSYLSMECISPFKNLWVSENDYLSFLHDPRGYMAEDPVPDHMQKARTKYDESLYPVLRLGDIKLNCNHSHTMEDAIADWNRRREKINWDFTLAQMDTCEPWAEKEFNLVDTVDRKICMVPYPTTEPYSIQIYQDTGAEYDWPAIVNGTTFPFHNPLDINSLFYGEWEDNPYFGYARV